MANKIINIGDNIKNTQSRSFVYKDVSMVSKYDTYHLISEVPTEEFISVIKSEYPDIDMVLCDDIYTCFLMHYKEDPNPTIEKINDILRNKSGYKIDKLIDVKSVQNSLENIFSWTPGERILLPQFGNRLYQYLYEGINKFNEEQIIAEIKNCVSMWEPRVTITDITNISDITDTEDNTIILNIEYFIKGLDSIIYSKQYQYNRNQ